MGEDADHDAHRRRFDLAAVRLNERQRKGVQRLLDDGDGGLLGGLDAEKCGKMTGASEPTATHDLAALVRQGLPWTTGAGKALRYHVAVPGWTHGLASHDSAARGSSAFSTPASRFDVTGAACAETALGGAVVSLRRPSP